MKNSSLEIYVLNILKIMKVVCMKIKVKELPVDLQSDRNFLVAAVNENSNVWRSLSSALKDDIDNVSDIIVKGKPCP